MTADFQKYQDHINEKVLEVKAGPVEKRSCTDIVCLIFFILVFIGTLILGGVFLHKGKGEIWKLVAETGDNATSLGKVMVKHVGPIIGMLILSNVLSVVFILLAKNFPRCLFYTMMVITFFIYLAIIIIGFVLKSYGLAFIFIVIFAINALILWCYWDYIKIGLKLIECAARFLTEKPSIYFISLISLALNLIFTIFWIFAWVGASALSLDSDTYSSLSILWYAIGVFFTFLLYYFMVFAVASAVAFWYYQNENTNVIQGFLNLKYHLGSVAFGSLVITIITVMRVLAETQKANNNSCLGCIACCMALLLSCIEELVKVLNHNAIICMSVTGEGYVDSAKSAIGLIFDNFGVFIIIDFFVDFMEVYSVIFAVLIPALIGGGIIYASDGTDFASTYAIWGAIIIFFLALLLSEVILGMLEEVLSSIFIFYCFDQKFRKMGIPVHNIPREIKQIMDEASGNNQAH